LLLSHNEKLFTDCETLLVLANSYTCRFTFCEMTSTAFPNNNTAVIEQIWYLWWPSGWFCFDFGL